MDNCFRLRLPRNNQQLNLAERQKVKEANLDFIRDEKISAIETNVLYALATKPQTANFK